MDHLAPSFHHSCVLVIECFPFNPAAPQVLFITPLLVLLSGQRLMIGFYSDFYSMVIRYVKWAEFGGKNGALAVSRYSRLEQGNSMYLIMEPFLESRKEPKIMKCSQNPIELIFT